MSIKNSIANCKKSFAQGSSRQVFYSKLYDVVIKLPYEEGHNSCTANRQSLTEKLVYTKATKAQKEFFPIVMFVKNEKTNDVAVIMKKIDYTLDELGIDLDDDCLDRFRPAEQKKFLWDLKRQFKLKFSVALFMKTIKDLGLRDLHRLNLGIMGDKLVIIDFGW